MKLRDHPKDWCIRLTVYKPDAFRNQTHSYIGFQGPVDGFLGAFLEALPGGVCRLDANDVEALKAMTRKMRNERHPQPVQRCQQCGAGPGDTHTSDICR